MGICGKDQFEKIEKGSGSRLSVIAATFMKIRVMNPILHAPGPNVHTVDQLPYCCPVHHLGTDGLTACVPA